MRQGNGRWHHLCPNIQAQFELRLRLHASSYSHTLTVAVTTTHPRSICSCKFVVKQLPTRDKKIQSHNKMQTRRIWLFLFRPIRVIFLFTLVPEQPIFASERNKGKCLERCQANIELVAPCGMHLPLQRASSQLPGNVVLGSKLSNNNVNNISCTKPSFHRSIE